MYSYIVGVFFSCFSSRGLDDDRRLEDWRKLCRHFHPRRKRYHDKVFSLRRRSLCVKHTLSAGWKMAHLDKNLRRYRAIKLACNMAISFLTGLRYHLNINLSVCTPLLWCLVLGSTAYMSYIQLSLYLLTTASTVCYNSDTCICFGCWPVVLIYTGYDPFSKVYMMYGGAPQMGRGPRKYLYLFA